MIIVRDPESLDLGAYPVVALGNFDGLHLGHRAILKTAIERARGVAGGRAFAFTFDPLPAKVLAPERAPALLLTSEDKFELLAELGLDGVIVLTFTRDLSKLGPEEFVRQYLTERLRIRVVVVGGNVSFGHRRAGNAELLAALGKELGFETIIAPPVTVEGEKVSSTRIRHLIACGELDIANKLIGRPHFLRGSIVHGRQRGRKIGFPTANLDSLTECIPPNGVYASQLVLPGGEAHPAITNIGTRPTFDETQRTIEAHVFDFDRDIYGLSVKLELISRIRPERKFESPEALSNQIARDVLRAREILAA